MKKIAIVSAMYSELKYIRNYFENNNTFKEEKFNGYQSYYNDDTRFFLVHTGIGKINTCITLSQFYNNINPGFSVLTGICGSISSKIKQGSVIIADKTAQFDTIGCVNNQSIFLNIDNKKYQKVSTEFFNTNNVKEYNIIKTGILTGDTVLLDTKYKNRLFGIFGQDYTVLDMESYAFSAVSNNYKIPCSICKIVSDDCSADINIKNSNKRLSVKEFGKQVYEKIVNNDEYENYVKQINLFLKSASQYASF